MTIIYLSEDQSGDQNLIQGLCRSVSSLSKTGSVLLLRAASFAENGEAIDSGKTLSRGKYFSSHLNEAGVAVVSVEGPDKGLLKFGSDEQLMPSNYSWLMSLLNQSVVVSLSLFGKGPNEQLKAVGLDSFLEFFSLSERKDNTILALIHPQSKSYIELEGERQKEVEISKLIEDDLISDNKLLRSIEQLVNLDIRVTNPIGLLSEKMERSSKIRV